MMMTDIRYNEGHFSPQPYTLQRRSITQRHAILREQGEMSEQVPNGTGPQHLSNAQLLEQAFFSREKFPINLEWMVDVFQYLTLDLTRSGNPFSVTECRYKHISSLTTHLKRHFKANVHYKRLAHSENKRVWMYFISIKCFVGICEYGRHAKRKEIAQAWLKKAGVKISMKRRRRMMPLEGGDPPSSSSSSSSLSEYSSSSSSSFSFTSSSSSSSSASSSDEGDHTAEGRTSKKRKRSRRHHSRRDRHKHRDEGKDHDEHHEDLGLRPLKKELHSDSRAHRPHMPYLPHHYYNSHNPLYGSTPAHNFLPPLSHDAFRASAAGAASSPSSGGPPGGKMIRSIVRPTYKKITYYDDPSCTSPHSGSMAPLQALAASLSANGFHPNFPSYLPENTNNGNNSSSNNNNNDNSNNNYTSISTNSTSSNTLIGHKNNIQQTSRLPQNESSKAIPDNFNHINATATTPSNPTSTNTVGSNTVAINASDWNSSKKQFDNNTMDSDDQKVALNPQHPFLPTYPSNTTSYDPNVHYMMLRNAHLRTLHQIQNLYASMSNLAPNKHSQMFQPPTGLQSTIPTYPNPLNKPVPLNTANNYPETLQDINGNIAFGNYNCNSHNGANDTSSLASNTSDLEDNDVDEDGNESGYCGDYNSEDEVDGSLTYRDHQYPITTARSPSRLSRHSRHSRHSGHSGHSGHSRHSRQSWHTRTPPLPVLFSTPSPISYASSPSQSPCPSPSPTPSLSSSPSRLSSPSPPLHNATWLQQSSLSPIPQEDDNRSQSTPVTVLCPSQSLPSQGLQEPPNHTQLNIPSSSNYVSHTSALQPSRGLNPGGNGQPMQTSPTYTNHPPYPHHSSTTHNNQNPLPSHNLHNHHNPQNPHVHHLQPSLPSQGSQWSSSSEIDGTQPMPMVQHDHPFFMHDFYAAGRGFLPVMDEFDTNNFLSIPEEPKQ